jgi:SWI/SNF-related matrix-associated actin-dependent regulator of chromatin subfamily A3
MYSLRVNILLFTLPANIKYISDSLIHNHLYLDDPFPPYDPKRHSDQPPYDNPQGIRSAEALARARYGFQPQFQPQIGVDRINQIEVQRKQVDEVFQSIESGGELDQSDPGESR